MQVHDVTGPSRASLSRTADLYDLGKDTRYLLHNFSALLVGYKILRSYKSSQRPRPLPSLCNTDNDLPICFTHHKQRTITFLFSLSLSLLFHPFPLSPPIILHLSSPFIFFLSPTPFLPHFLLFRLPIFSSCGCLGTVAAKPPMDISPVPKGVAKRVEKGHTVSVLGRHPMKWPDDDFETSIPALMINPLMNASSSNRRVVTRGKGALTWGAH